MKTLSDVLFSQIESEILKASGLSGAEFGVLSRLQDLGQGRLKQQVLVQAMQWNKSRLSHQLTRMESRRFLKRERAGRCAEVVMLSAGRKALEAASPVHARAVRKYLKRFTPEETNTLLAIFEKISAG